jgi:hypothetical protein
MADSRASQAESNKERTAIKQGEGELSHTEAMWVAARRLLSDLSESEGGAGRVSR